MSGRGNPKPRRPMFSGRADEWRQLAESWGELAADKMRAGLYAGNDQMAYDYARLAAHFAFKGGLIDRLTDESTEVPS